MFIELVVNPPEERMVGCFKEIPDHGTRVVGGGVWQFIADGYPIVVILWVGGAVLMHVKNSETFRAKLSNILAHNSPETVGVCIQLASDSLADQLLHMAWSHGVVRSFSFNSIGEFLTRIGARLGAQPHVLVRFSDVP